ncbi:MAG: DegT/DnrJ/EryC1/StrS family aminotransferase [Betaproteobacteria bacterium]|nr:DegT/DnrJ/EryC1/StrS family aminotransferase [Betaproteobacteria bacterium]
MSRSELFQHQQLLQSFRVRCLIPDLPEAEALLPLLRQIDANAWYSNFGPLVHRYEEMLGVLTGAQTLGGEAVTLSSGTAALVLGLRALDLPVGSRVLLPAFTFAATLLAVREAGLVPVLGDVDAEDWTLTPDIARALCTRHDIQLVLPVGSLGAALPAEQWDDFVASTGVRVLIDAAAGLGVQRVGRRTPVAYSLHATKPLGIGEGGVFATADATLAERVRRSSNFGFVGGAIAQPGLNAKMSEYAAAVGLVQLDRWPKLHRLRQALWQTYREALAELPGVRLQQLAQAPAMIVARHQAGAAAMQHTFAAAGIETRRWYLPPLHRHPAFLTVEVRGPEGDTRLPVTEALESEALGLPFHTRLGRNDIEAVVATLRAVGA